jgi:ABC-type antimicrobial peptide transport system permease subunit
MDPALPFREVHTMSEEVENSMASERLSALVGVCIGACAALFAGAGIYGSLSYLATQRRREIAIRMALGAGRPHTAMLVAKRTLLMVATGTLAGIVGACFAGVAVRSVLFKVSPQDGWSMASAIVFVALTAAAATAVPVMRAMRQQPADLLRSEN